MTGDASDRITGEAWTVRQIFTGRHYILDNYQREYAWERSHLHDLIDDLCHRFLEQWKPGHETRDVANYRSYFLGPIVTFRRGSQSVIVDGQQRLTTLMLLFIWLDRLQGDRDDAVPGVANLAFSDHFGDLSFAVEDPLMPRKRYLVALLDGRDQPLDTEVPRSVRTMLERFAEFDDLFPSELREEALPAFIYWLLDRVLLVEISTYNQDMALETFETMNDRGLRLSGPDLLKSFILSKVGSGSQADVNFAWRRAMDRLAEADRNGPMTFIKAWLRAKYARDAADDEAIGGSYERWLRLNHESVELRFPGQFHSLVTQELDTLSRRYVTLLGASRRPVTDLDPVYFNGQNAVTVQFPLILAAVRADDSDSVFAEKARLIAGYLDILVARRIASGQDFRTDAISPTIFALGREIRGLDPASLRQRLADELVSAGGGFGELLGLALRSSNRSRVKYLLARISAWLDVQTRPSETDSYAEAFRKYKPFEIEHVWADRPEHHPEVSATRFPALRNRFGGLLLLPRDVNASLGSRTYAEKLKTYRGQNVLAQSLHSDTYLANPAFRKIIETYDLPFREVSDFSETAMGERQSLYRHVCEVIWAPVQYGLPVPADKSRQVPRQRARAHFGVSLAQLVDGSHIGAGARLVGTHQGVRYHAEVTATGAIRLASGETFPSPSAAASAALDRPSWNGWAFWRIESPDGANVSLDAIRKTALREGRVG